MMPLASANDAAAANGGPGAASCQAHVQRSLTTADVIACKLH
jgi:hypothetical protein